MLLSTAVSLSANNVLHDFFCASMYLLRKILREPINAGEQPHSGEASSFESLSSTVSENSDGDRILFPSLGHVACQNENDTFTMLIYIC